MIDKISRRLRLFMKSELDLHKDRLLEELRTDQFTAQKAEARKQEIDLQERLSASAQEKAIVFDPETHGFIFEGMMYLNSLVLRLGAKLNVLEDGSVEVRIGSASIVPETFQEIGIIKEIFEDEVYLVESGQPMYVWDVGANIGTASLYFASALGWDVSAYELFPETAKAAAGNIGRSGLSDRIELNAFGVGRRNEELTLKYNARSRGSNGMFGNTDPTVSGEEVPIKVQVIDADEAFKKVQAKAGDRPILAKFDCEGAEYDIIPRLLEAGHLRSLAGIVMEEHILPGHNREALVNLIRDAGFMVRRKRRMDKHVSMLFACRMG